MGYYTRYELFADGVRVSANAETVKCDKCGGTGKLLVEHDVANKAAQELDEMTNGFSPLSDTCKWYEHQKDMETISAKMPDVLFELHGEGEESGDIWRKQFKGGKMLSEKKAKIVFD